MDSQQRLIQDLSQAGLINDQEAIIQLHLLDSTWSEWVGQVKSAPRQLVAQVDAKIGEIEQHISLKPSSRQALEFTLARYRFLKGFGLSALGQHREAWQILKGVQKTPNLPGDFALQIGAFCAREQALVVTDDVRSLRDAKNYRGAIERATEGIAAVEKDMRSYPNLSSALGVYLPEFYSIRARCRAMLTLEERDKNRRKAELNIALQDVEKALSFPRDYYDDEYRAGVQELRDTIKGELKKCSGWW